MEQSIFKHALLNYNHNGTNRRFELQAFVDVINTADAFKLSRLSKYIQVEQKYRHFSFFHFLLVYFQCLSCLCFFSHRFSHLCYFFFCMYFAVCNQFSRGVFAILGAISPESFVTLHSYSNTFQMPFLSSWYPEKV